MGLLAIALLGFADKISPVTVVAGFFYDTGVVLQG